MSQYVVTDSQLSSIADAIRTKGGTSASLAFPVEFISAINAIHTASVVSLSVASNGTYTPATGVDGFAPVVVSVPMPSGTKNLSYTANGIYTEDVSSFASASITVNVPNTYSASDEGKVVSSGTLVSQSSRNITANGTYDTTTNNQVVVQVSGGGTTVSVSQILSSGTKIAVIDVDNVDTDIYAPTPPVFNNTTVTLEAANWSGNSQTVSVTGVTATNTIFVNYAPSSKTAYTSYDIYCSSQGNGTLTFLCNPTPSVDIDVNVSIVD